MVSRLLSANVDVSHQRYCFLQNFEGKSKYSAASLLQILRILVSLTLAQSTMGGQVGHKRRRSKSDRSTNWPNQPQLKRSRRRVRDLSCGVCTIMFSHQGLQYLNSPSGFRHRNRTDCMACADEGCGMCKLIFYVVCKEHDADWAPNDRLIFRNFRNPQSLSTASMSQLPGIYGLEGALESEPTKSIITIQLFAKASR